MERKFNKIQIAAIKRTAQNVSSYVTKKEKLNAEIEKIEATKKEMVKEALAKVDEKIALKKTKIEIEKKALQQMIDAFQGPIKEMTGGYTTEDLVTREVVKTGKFDDKTGKEIVQTRFTLKYPETVIPIEVPMTEVGNDYDKDREEMPDEEFMARVEQEEAMVTESNDDPWA